MLPFNILQNLLILFSWKEIRKYFLSSQLFKTHIRAIKVYNKYTETTKQNQKRTIEIQMENAWVEEMKIMLRIKKNLNMRIK